MGKKKDKRERKEQEQAAGKHGCEPGTKHGTKHGAKHDTNHGNSHGGSAPLAGIAAAIARQMGTPVGRQMIAAGLMAAATAISKHEPKPSVRPAPPTPPAPPSPPAEPDASKVAPDTVGDQAKPQGAGPFAGDTPEPPRSETNPLPPEFAKVLDSVSAGLDRLISGFGKPKDTPPST
ncbi:hypothetical protein IFR23_04850 [Sphingomonas sp. CFBP 13603]|uniref:hypothetical protein n=1 Tax=Sphingomonas sp. CFBP 13603 TaxID=2774040 RepID=UPI0018693CD4|nr:hypothetical protein [Sphingomonas sp. CFBP 13603]MBE2991340.1 hypothetical protein [Sphingomonas sp. CFBP 13603]